MVIRVSLLVKSKIVNQINIFKNANQGRHLKLKFSLSHSDMLLATYITAFYHLIFQIFNSCIKGGPLEFTELWTKAG